MSTTQTGYAQHPDPWVRETQRLIRTIFRIRFVFFVLIALIFSAYAIWDPVLWKLVWILATGVVMLALSGFEYWRIHRSPAGMRTIQANLAGVLLVQTSMIYITGGIESPILLIYVPLGLVTGLSLGSLAWVLPVVSLPFVATLCFALGALGGWLPRATPGFFGLGPGFYQQPAYVWITAAAVIVFTAGTAFAGTAVRRVYQGIVQQVTQARRENLEALARRNRELRSVAGTVAHELKNPLSSIQGLAQLLVRAAPPGTKDHERLDVMLREIGRMRTVLDEFRSFSRPLSGLSLERVGLRKLIEDLILLSEGSAKGRSVELSPTVQETEILCDPHKIKQALLNLLQNSLDATSDRDRIEFEIVSLQDARVQIRLSDSGPGLAPEVGASLFTAGLTTKETGSGIGLVVARSIAEQHGGELTLANRPRGGCLAALTLPLDASAAEEEAL
jgi:two-component system sensor histidine kinase HydH